MNNDPFISIIIPTFNRANILRKTVESFVDQSYPKNMYEIVIADNNSTDGTKHIVEKLIQENDIPIRYLYEKRQGVHYARNSAAKVAIGNILYFTDDDMVADKNLLKEIVKPFYSDQRIACVTGRVLPKWEMPPPDWIIKLCLNSLLSLNDPPEDFIVSASTVFSCHQAILREVFFISGGFNPENTDGEWIGDGETGLNLTIEALGYNLGYNGSSIIYHVIPPQRMTQSYLNKRLSNQGNCDSYTEYKNNRYSNHKLMLLVACHFIKMIVSEIKCMINISNNRDIWRINHARFFYYLSRIKYDYRLMVDESWREFVLKRNWIQDTDNMS